MKIFEKDALESFLSEMMLNHTHALTITLSDDSFDELTFNRKLRLEKTIHHLLYRLARKCFKNRHKREKLCIGCVAVVEGGSENSRLHAHLALHCPPDISHDHFQSMVLSSIEKCKSLGKQSVIKPITSMHGWASYMAKDGAEAFSPQCTQRAKH